MTQIELLERIDQTKKDNVTSLQLSDKEIHKLPSEISRGLNLEDLVLFGR